MTIEQQKLRQCFGTFMTGVTVVTTIDDKGKPIGFTANSFTSVSLDPPLLLICVDNSSDHIETYSNGSGFVINVLAENQKDLSNRFLDHKSLLQPQLKIVLKASTGRKVNAAIQC